MAESAEEWVRFVMPMQGCRRPVRPLAFFRLIAIKVSLFERPSLSTKPAGRNYGPAKSGPAVAVAAALAARRSPDAKSRAGARGRSHCAQVGIFPRSLPRCRRAPWPPKDGQIVTFGIVWPTTPATNFGYIRPGARLNGSGPPAPSRPLSRSPMPGDRHALRGRRNISGTAATLCSVLISCWTKLRALSRNASGGARSAV